MSISELPTKYRLADFYYHIDMGFLNRRLAITALGPIRQHFLDRRQAGEDHFTQLANDHLLVTMLLDVCTELKVPTLAEALELARPTRLFSSIERLEPCPEVYDSERVNQVVHLDFEPSKPVFISYHTRHIVADTGRMALAEGHVRGFREAMIGLVHDRGDRFEIEPVVMGAPWIEHPRNPGGDKAVWVGGDFGEILPEDIAEFSAMNDVETSNADEWMSVMRSVPEAHVKASIATLLAEPVKADWGGEENDHFSANVTVGGRRRTAAFLLKGPTRFSEMTPAMCGANGDQIYRLAKSGADISVVQHSHLIGAAVRETVRAFIVQPGSRHRKFCVVDGQATYRLLKAYNLLPV